MSKESRSLKWMQLKHRFLKNKMSPNGKIVYNMLHFPERWSINPARENPPIHKLYLDKTHFRLCRGNGLQFQLSSDTSYGYDDHTSNLWDKLVLRSRVVYLINTQWVVYAAVLLEKKQSTLAPLEAKFNTLLVTTTPEKD